MPTIKRSLMPVQSAPVRRPELVHPHLTVDAEHGEPEALFSLRMELLHGANYNDPPAFDHCAASYYYGGDCCGWGDD